MLLMHALDLRCHYYYEALAYRALAEQVLEGRMLQLTNGSKSTYACLVRIKGKTMPNTSVGLDDKGMVSFPGREDLGKWVFKVGHTPVIAANDDVFLVLTTGKAVPEFPVKAIDVNSATAANSLVELRDSKEFLRVSVQVKAQDVTEKQQWKALMQINSKSAGQQVANMEHVPALVCPILAGHGIKDVQSVSYFSDGFVEEQMANIEELHIKFAGAISREGAHLSDEQLGFVFGYLNEAPEDQLLLLDGFAGTRKTSTLSLAASMFLLDDLQAEGRLVLVVAKMHKTINTTAETMKSVVEGLTGRIVFREYSDMWDLCLAEWFINGCPRTFDDDWTAGMDGEERRELRDLMDCLERSVGTAPGASSKIPETTLRLSVLWRIFNAMGLIQKTPNGAPLYPRQLETSGPAPDAANIQHQQGTKRSRAEDDLDTEVGPAKTRKGLSAEKIAGSHIQDSERKILELVGLIQERLQAGDWDKAKKKAALQLLRSVKFQWTKQFVGVIYTTISRADSTGIKS